MYDDADALRGATFHMKCTVVPPPLTQVDGTSAATYRKLTTFATLKPEESRIRRAVHRELPSPRGGSNGPEQGDCPEEGLRVPRP